MLFDRVPRVAEPVTLDIGCIASASNAARNDLTQGMEAELIDQPSTTCVHIAAVVMAREGCLVSLMFPKFVRLVVATAINGIQMSRKLNSIVTVTFLCMVIIDLDTRNAGVATRTSSVAISKTRMVMFRPSCETVSLQLMQEYSLYLAHQIAASIWWRMEDALKVTAGRGNKYRD